MVELERKKKEQEQEGEVVTNSDSETLPPIVDNEDSEKVVKPENEDEEGNDKNKGLDEEQRIALQMIEELLNRN